MYVLMDLCNYLETGSAASGSVTSLVLKLEYGNQSLKNKNINNFYDTELEIEYFFVLSVLWDFENDFVCLFNLSIFFNFSLFCSIFQCRFFFYLRYRYFVIVHSIFQLLLYLLQFSNVF